MFSAYDIGISMIKYPIFPIIYISEVVDIVDEITNTKISSQKVNLGVEKLTLPVPETI